MVSNSFFEPGMQDGVGALIDGLRTQFPCCRAKKREKCGCFATNVLVGLAHRIPFWPPRCARKWKRLIGSSFIFVPDLETQLFSERVRSLYQRFFPQVGVVALFHHAIFSFAQRDPGFPPGSALLPGVASFMQGMQDGKGTHLW